MSRRTVAGRSGVPAGSVEPARPRPGHPGSPVPTVLSAVAGRLRPSLAAVSRLGLVAALGTAVVASGTVADGAVRAVPAAAAPAATSSAPSTGTTTGGPAGTATTSLDRIELAATGVPTAAARRATAIRVAKKYVGVRYRYGGTTPRGFDCSGYTKYVWSKAGKKLPRTSRAQYAKVRKVSRKNARAGDLVFFKSSSGRVYHVGIYAGHNKMYDAPRTGKRISLRKIWSSRVTFGRVV